MIGDGWLEQFRRCVHLNVMFILFGKKSQEDMDPVTCSAPRSPIMAGT